MIGHQWKSEKLYLDNDHFYRDLLAEIESAQRTVEMEVFTFENGILAQRLLNAFTQVRKRGVRVRLLIDGWGSGNFWNDIGPQLENVGVRITIHRALPWRSLRHSHGEPRSLMAKLWYRIRKINRGFHRKTTIIDGQVAWVSSLNVSDVHLNEVYGNQAWHDIGGRFTGDGVRVLRQSFEKAFYRKRWLRLRRLSQFPYILLNDSFFRRRYSMYIHRRRLGRANHRIWIQTPYFLPERSLLLSLYNAAKKNVDVKVIIPEKNDQPVVKLLTTALLSQLLNNGVRVFEFQPRFSHKKVLIVDRVHTIGSTNFNHRSFLHDLEVEVHLTSNVTKAVLRESFKEDLIQSIELTSMMIDAKPLWYRFLGRILFFVRFWC